MLKANAIHLKINNNTLLDNIDYSIEAGSFNAIIGPNGAGKTSFLKVLSGEVKCDSGTVLLAGAELHSWPDLHRAKHMAVLPQYSTLNFPFKVEELVLLARNPHSSGAQADDAIATEVLEAMDISHLRHALYTQLSGGEKQRVQLARVLCQIWRAEDADTRLLLLDEPTSALDLEHQHSLMQTLSKLCGQGIAVVMVMHDFNLASQYADSILVMHKAGIYAQGSAEEVLKPELFKTIFNIDVSVLAHPNTQRPIVVVS